MAINYVLGTDPYNTKDVYDPDEKKYYSLTYRPEVYANDTEYRNGEQLIIPTVSTGLMYECTSSGISGSVEPTTWPTIEGGIVQVGTAEFKARSYTLLLLTGDAITVSSWLGTNGETIDNQGLSGGAHTRFRLTAVLVGADTATITNSITVLRANGDTEEFNRSIIIPVKEL